MADLRVDVNDNTNTVSALGRAEAAEEKRTTYKVVAKDGIFKNGKTLKRGEVVELTETTAQSAIEAGDLEEIA